MNKYICILFLSLALVWGCNSKQDSAKSGEEVEHNHEGHDHSTCGGDHSHDGEKHSHEGEEHSHEGHNHATGDGHDHDHATEADGHSHAAGEEHNHDDHADHNHNHAEGDGHDHADAKNLPQDVIEFSPEQAKDAGLATTQVKPASFHRVIKTSGKILSAQGDEVSVVAKTSGVVSFAQKSLNEGAAIKAGESLLYISSKNVGEGDPVSKAKSAFDIAKLEYDRAESLIKDNLISKKEYNEIKLNYENAKVSYDTFSGNSSAKGVGISSPIGGYVKSNLVSEGQYVEVGQQLMIITQNRKMQLQATVSEKYYGELSNIVSANFKTSYDDNFYRLSDINGKVLSYGKSSSDQDFFLPVNFEFDNVGKVVAGSYAEVYLLAQPRENVISIPLTSLIEEQGLYFIYLKHDDYHYSRKEVKIGADDGEKVEILAGLSVGDNVVSKAAYNVKMASMSSAVPHGHEH